MFGHDDQDKKDDAANPALPPDDAAASSTAEVGTVTAPSDDAGASDNTTATDATDSTDQSTETRPYLVTDEPKTEEKPSDLPTPVMNDPVPEPAAASPAPAPASTPDDLLGIKLDALKQLSPLVDQLNQTPEEKFRTMMMMIQASDDDSLIKSAFDAAKNITDEKTRAQALLDIVNEINYFTQQNAS